MKIQTHDLIYIAHQFRIAAVGNQLDGHCLNISASFVAIMNTLGFSCSLGSGEYISKNVRAFHAWVDVGSNILDMTITQFLEGRALPLHAGCVYFGKLPKFLVRHGK